MLRAGGGAPRPDDRFRPVRRERVMVRLRDAAAFRVAGIVAPAGFGKTVALRHYLQFVPDAVVYDVPPEATSLPAFVRGFAAALGALVPALARTVATASESVRSSPRRGEDLASWAAFHLRDRRITVAIDDLQAGDADPAIAAFVIRLAESTGDGVRFVFSSRTASGLPFASWTAYGLCDLPIDADDLRLTLPEAMACAGYAARERDVAEILDRVGGWPTAFGFALRTAARAQDLVAANEATRDMVYRYLAEQVWHGLGASLRAFLRTVAFLPLVDVPLCVAAGYDDALALIESLRSQATFVTKRGENEYALHDLFRDFVRHEVRRDGEAAVAQAWRTAARTLAVAGRLSDAIEALIRARDEDAIAAFLTVHGLGFADRGQLDVVERALAVVGEDGDGATPVVAALRGMCAEARGFASEAERRFRTALAGVGALDSTSAVDVATKIAVYHARYDRADALGAIHKLQQRADLTGRQRAVLLDIEAVTLAFTDHVEEAVGVIHRALAAVDRPEIDADARSKVHANAALVFYHAGDEAAMRRYAASAIEGALICGNHRRAAAVWMNLHLMHAGRGRAREAARCAAKAVEEAMLAGDFEYQGIGLRAQLKVAAERGDEAEIERLRGSLVGVPSTSRCGMIYEIIALALAFPWTARFDDAREVLGRLPDSDLVVVQNRTRYALLALVSAASGAEAEAESALLRHRDFVAPDPGRRAIFDRTNALSDRWTVLAELLLHGPARARAELAAALPLPADLAGLDESVDAALAGDRARFERGLGRLRRAGKSGFARFADAVCAAHWPTAQPQLAAAATLTNAERRILQALADGLSNQAIADRHQRSVHTVRTQVASLLAKLGASSRGEAAAIARRSSLVDQPPP